MRNRLEAALTVEIRQLEKLRRMVRGLSADDVATEYLKRQPAIDVLALAALPAETVDSGMVRLGSACITGQFPASSGAAAPPPAKGE